MKKSKFTEEQIVRILQEAQSGQSTQADLCRKHGVSPNTFYLWKRKYSGMEQRDVRLLRDLEAENAQLKRTGGRDIFQTPPNGCHWYSRNENTSAFLQSLPIRFPILSASP